ncbi:hypothetical protein TNCV_3334251 [Trichonephila clavipes]|nr:hypothetical protein TNCV_3334251 [Trichonephila clavipes]
MGLSGFRGAPNSISLSSSSTLSPHIPWATHWRSSSSNIARVMKVARLNETFPQAELQSLEQVECEVIHRAAETPEQSQARR